MRFLLDSNLSPRVATLMRAADVNVEHVRDHGLQAEPDVVILAFARDNEFVVVSEDTDFGELLARERAARPSLVLLRTNGPMTPDEHAGILLANLPTVHADLGEAQWSSSAATGSGCAVCPCCHPYPISVKPTHARERYGQPGSPLVSTPARSLVQTPDFVRPNRIPTG